MFAVLVIIIATLICAPMILSVISDVNKLRAQRLSDQAYRRANSLHRL